MLPELIQSNTGTTVAVAVPERYEKKIGQDSAHATNSAPVVTAFAATLPSARLPSPEITPARRGRDTAQRQYIQHPRADFERKSVVKGKSAHVSVKLGGL